jgi:hypothetical protein
MARKRMRKQNKIFHLFVAAYSLFLLVAGCENPATTDDSKQQGIAGDPIDPGFFDYEDHWGSGVGDGYTIDPNGRLEFLMPAGYTGTYGFVSDIRYHKTFPAETISSRDSEQVSGDSGVFIIEYRDPLPQPGGETVPGRFQGIYYWGLGSTHNGTSNPTQEAGKPQVFMANSANLAALGPQYNSPEDGSTGVNPETRTLREAIEKFTLARRNSWVAYAVVYPQIKDCPVMY